MIWTTGSSQPAEARRFRTNKSQWTCEPLLLARYCYPTVIIIRHCPYPCYSRLTCWATRSQCPNYRRPRRLNSTWLTSRNSGTCRSCSTSYTRQKGGGKEPPSTLLCHCIATLYFIVEATIHTAQGALVKDDRNRVRRQIKRRPTTIDITRYVLLFWKTIG